MSLRKYRNKRDDNEGDIIKALEAIGCSVFRLDVPCDLLCGYRQRTYLLEIKNPEQPKWNRKKTKAQDKFFAEWNGQIDIVETAEQAIRIVTNYSGETYEHRRNIRHRNGNKGWRS